MKNRIVSVHPGIYGIGIYSTMPPSSGISVTHGTMTNNLIPIGKVIVSVEKNRYHPYNILDFLRISRKLFSFCVVDPKLSCFVRRMSVKGSKTAVMNFHITGNTFVNIRINSHTFHFHHSDWIPIVRDC